jgi:hypothetical protein
MGFLARVFADRVSARSASKPRQAAARKGSGSRAGRIESRTAGCPFALRCTIDSDGLGWFLFVLTWAPSRHSANQADQTGWPWLHFIRCSRRPSRSGKGRPSVIRYHAGSRMQVIWAADHFNQSGYGGAMGDQEENAEAASHSAMAYEGAKIHHGRGTRKEKNDDARLGREEKQS